MPGTALKVRSNEAFVVSSADETNPGKVLCKLAYGQRVTGYEIKGNFTRVAVPDANVSGYVISAHLIDEAAVLYASIPKSSRQETDLKGKPVFEKDGKTPVMETDELVDVRLYAPTVKINLVFATDRNFMGRVLYPRCVPLLQKAVALKLKKAADLFAKDGYAIVLYDAYRPLSVQKILFDAVQDGTYVSNPYTGASKHNRGAAVDITLCDTNGKELDMPTPVHTLNSAANRKNPKWTAKQNANVNYMTKIMNRAGFVSISSEWWHFQDPESELFMVTDLDFAAIRMAPLSELQ